MMMSRKQQNMKAKESIQELLPEKCQIFDAYRIASRVLPDKRSKEGGGAAALGYL